MNNIIYLLIILFGFLSLFISCFLINNKFRFLSLESFLYSYIFSVIFFVIFSKLFYIISELDFSCFKNFLFGNLNDVFRFVLSGYSFIGGYLGVIISNYIYSKIIKEDFKKILFVYIISMILMYSILKLGCFIKGCCFGMFFSNIQVIESIINLIIYIYLLLSISDNIYLMIGKGLIGFSFTRFIISMDRVYSSIYSFIVVLVILIIMFFIGLNLISVKRSNHGIK